MRREFEEPKLPKHVQRDYHANECDQRPGRYPVKSLMVLGSGNQSSDCDRGGEEESNSPGPKESSYSFGSSTIDAIRDLHIAETKEATVEDQRQNTGQEHDHSEDASDFLFRQHVAIVWRRGKIKAPDFLPTNQASLLAIYGPPGPWNSS